MEQEMNKKRTKNKKYSVKNKTVKNNVLVKKETKEKINKVIEKTIDIFYITKILNCNYTITQKQLLEILNIYNFKYRVDRNIYTEVDKQKKREILYKKDSEIDYTEFILNKLVRKMIDCNLIERYFPPLPDGRFSKCASLHFNYKAVSLYKDVNINSLNKECRKINNNTQEFLCMLKAQYLINNKDYFLSKYNSLDINKINTFFTGENYTKFYQFFVDNNINKENNLKTLEQINIDLNRIKYNTEDKKVNTSSVENIVNRSTKVITQKNKNLFTLKSKFIYLLDLDYNKELHKTEMDFCIFSPYTPSTAIEYIYKVDNLTRVIEDVFDVQSKLDSKYTDYSKEEKYNINIYFIVNDESEKKKLTELLTNKLNSNKDNKVKQIFKQNFVLNQHTTFKEISVINLPFIFSKNNVKVIEKIQKDVSLKLEKIEKKIQQENKYKDKYRNAKECFTNQQINFNSTYNLNQAIMKLIEREYKVYGIEEKTDMLLASKTKDMSKFLKIYERLDFDEDKNIFYFRKIK